MLIRMLLSTFLFTLTEECPENPEPPCTCRFIGYHACIVTCIDVDNEISLVKSVQSMRAATVPIRTVEIFESSINYLPSELFNGLVFPRLFIAGSSMVSLSDSETAFVGLEDFLEILVVQEVILFSGWSWSQLRNLKVLTELATVKAGLQAIDEDMKDIAHLNITKLSFTQDSISYVYDKAFSMFQNLVSLSLKRNSIKTLKRSMFPYPAAVLQQLILSYNEIEFIPADLFAEMPSLQFIALAGNRILTVDESAFGSIWRNLKKIDFTDTPLRCDCRLNWLLKEPFPLNTWAKCEQPLKLKGVTLNQLKENDLWC